MPGLLRTVEGTIVSLTADGTYDGEPTYAAVAARQPEPPSAVVIPPRASAVPSMAIHQLERSRPPRPADGGEGAHGVAAADRLQAACVG